MNLVVQVRVYKQESDNGRLLPHQGTETLWIIQAGQCDDPGRIQRQLGNLPGKQHHIYPDMRIEIVPSREAEFLLSKAFDNFAACLEEARGRKDGDRDGN